MPGIRSHDLWQFADISQETLPERRNIEGCVGSITGSVLIEIVLQQDYLRGRYHPDARNANRDCRNHNKSARLVHP